MMSGFIKSRRFRLAWMVSLFAGLIFAFVEPAVNPASDLGYLERANDAFLQKALSFAAMFFVIQFAFAFLQYRRDEKSVEDVTK